jgi:hypothetical protein
MKQEIRAIANRILGQHPADDHLNPDKKAMIDFACQSLNMRSFADLGAVWNVDGGYTFYAMDKYHVAQAVLVDTDITHLVWKKQKQHPGLRIIEGNFGDPVVHEQVGKVDGVFFFDILLHQVRPDWNEILEMYSRVASSLLIFNQQFTNLSKTTRLLDLGREEYFRNIPHAANEEPYKTYFKNLDAIHPKHARPYRDIHNIWQWGIVDSDLISRLHDLGFKMHFYKNCGRLGRLQNVENHAFVFSRLVAS